MKLLQNLDKMPYKFWFILLIFCIGLQQHFDRLLVFGVGCISVFIICCKFIQEVIDAGPG